MEIKRRKLQGLLNIVSFNRHFYISGLLVLIAMIATHKLFNWPSISFFLMIMALSYALLVPLIVSAYVYDFSDYYSLNWLKDFNFSDHENIHILNINAGFDETSFTIKKHFPQSHLRVFDFYDAQKHTEPAIVRARKVSMVYPNTQSITSQKIPLENHSVDLIFLLSAAHEIRSEQERVQFLTECKRICKPTASIIMVEHLRDGPNFLAFSIGFTHFFSRKTWRKSFEKAGFSSFTEQKFTAFMSIFKFEI